MGISLERPRRLFSIERDAPSDLTAFAHISGDLNPIHRDTVFAILAGLPDPIVHGQWTAATMCALLAGTKKKLIWSEAQFLAPVMPGAALIFTADTIARIGGDDIVSAEVTADGVPVLQLRARIAGPKTALIFPGQGSQRRGMGMDACGGQPQPVKSGTEPIRIHEQPTVSLCSTLFGTIPRPST